MHGCGVVGSRRRDQGDAGVVVDASINLPNSNDIS